MRSKPARTLGREGDRPSLPIRTDYGPWIRRGVLFVSCALGLNALIGDRGLAESIRARRELERAHIEVARLKADNAALGWKAHLLNTDRQTIEHIARQELGLIRKGEVLVVLKDIPSK